MKRNGKFSFLRMIISGVLAVLVAFCGTLLSSNIFGKDESREPVVKEQYVNSNATKVRISLDEFIGWKPLLYANGGLITTVDSINARNGICVEYVIMNDANNSSNALISGELQGAGYTVNRYAFLQSKFDEAGVANE